MRMIVFALLDHRNNRRSRREPERFLGNEHPRRRASMIARRDAEPTTHAERLAVRLCVSSVVRVAYRSRLWAGRSMALAYNERDRAPNQQRRPSGLVAGSASRR